MIADDDLDDLKHFIVSTVGQTEARLSARLGRVESRLDGVEKRLTSLEHTVDDGFAAIGDALEQDNQRLDDHINDPNAHRLQPQAA
jgi:hypothetical protein